MPVLAQSMKLVKKLSIYKWLGLLDKHGILAPHRNHKCLLAKDTRIFLPPFMIQEEASDLFLQNLVKELSLPFAE